MQVKYIPIDIYNALSQQDNINTMTKVGSSVMPVLIATPAEVTAASNSGIRMSYADLASYLPAKLGIDVTRLVVPGYFASQQALDGFYYYSSVAPSADLVDFPLTVGSGHTMRQAIPEKEVTYVACDSYPQIAAATQSYYNYNGTMFASSGPISCCGNNSTGHRIQMQILVLRQNGMIFDAYGYCSWSVTDDGSTGAYYRYRCDTTGGNIIALFNSVTMIDDPTPTPTPTEDDPYSQGGTSGPGGGDGSFDFSSTPIDFQGLPNIGAYATGMIDLYVPSAGQLQALSAYLWAGAFDPDNFKKLFADPMDAILGLSIVPVTAAQIGTGAATLAVGNISTGLSMPTALSQYVSVDCGSINILPKWGAYLDFSPYSKLQLFLPYIGFVAISPDDCMNGSISVRYSVDILSGTCVAQVKCNDHVLYELAGTCSVACPVTAGQYQNIALTALRTVGSVAGTLAAAAAGNVGGVAAGLEDAANSVIASAKPEIQRSGGFGGSSGLMGHQIPFLILTIPKMCRPGDQNKYIGYPSFVTLALSDITGFTSVEAIHLENIPGACDDDLAEIDTLLKGGVFL